MLFFKRFLECFLLMEKERLLAPETPPCAELTRREGKVPRRLGIHQAEPTWRSVSVVAGQIRKEQTDEKRTVQHHGGNGKRRSLKKGCLEKGVTIHHLELDGAGKRSWKPP